MGVSAKVGSVVKIPIVTGWSAFSSNPGVLGVSQGSGQIILHALTQGISIVTMKLAPGLAVSLSIEVTAN